jgi:hypothetical protein
MMRSKTQLALALLSTLLAAVVSVAETPVPKENPEQAKKIEQLIDQLTSGSLEERDKARNELLLMPGALPALRRVQGPPSDPDLMRRAAAVAADLDRRLKDKDVAKALADVNDVGLDRFLEQMANTKGYATEERWDLTLQMARILVERANEVAGTKFLVPALDFAKMTDLLEPVAVVSGRRALLNIVGPGITRVSGSLVLVNGCISGVTQLDNSIVFVNGKVDGCTVLRKCVLVCTGEIGFTTLMEDCVVIAAGPFAGANTVRRSLFQVFAPGRLTVAQNNVYLNVPDVSALRASGNRFVDTTRGPLQLLSISAQPVALPAPRIVPPKAADSVP